MFGRTDLGHTLFMKITRRAPGYYIATVGDQSATISHIVTCDEGDGYGARDHWVVAGEQGQGVLDPVSHLWMAKEDAEALLTDAQGF